MPLMKTCQFSVDNSYIISRVNIKFILYLLAKKQILNSINMEHASTMHVYKRIYTFVKL